MSPLISVITPCYNAEKFISQAIESVIAQTFQDWEMLICDDCSTDKSVEIILNYCNSDSRVKYLKTDKVSGSPSEPRNVAIKEAKGKYIAFLDSDDIWLPDKLEKQLQYFSNEDIAIVYSNYEKISLDGIRSNRVIVAPDHVNYKKLLNGNVIGCLTAMYDSSKMGKVYFPKMGHEDYIVWLSILRPGYIAQNANEVLALYRESPNSVSSNKKSALVWTWNIYRHVEKLSLLSSIYHFMIYAFKGLMKFYK